MKQSTGDSGLILPASCRSRVSAACAAAARSSSALLSQPLCRCRGLQPLSAFQGVSLERRVWTDPAGASPACVSLWHEEDDFQSCDLHSPQGQSQCSDESAVLTAANALRPARLPCITSGCRATPYCLWRQRAVLHPAWFPPSLSGLVQASAALRSQLSDLCV